MSWYPACHPTRRNALAITSAIAFLAAVRSVAADEIIVDPAAAASRPDFKAQGEYEGEIRSEDGPLRVGVQVIARGGGKFDAFAYSGGLPGKGWDGETRLEASGRAEGDQVRITADEGGSAVIEGGRLTVQNDDGEEIGTLAKVDRKSPTLGQEPPRDAIVLFDGTSTWRFKEGRMTPDHLLRQGATTHERFGDGMLHIEFRTPFRPEARGQERGNSGVYLQSRYEVQVLDSFGEKPADNLCGGIYSVAAPRINVCFPPLEWQSYDIEFREARFDKDGKLIEHARMTVRHNGVLVHENVEIDHATTAAPIGDLGPAPGPLFIQDHGNEVRYRNIWFVPAK